MKENERNINLEDNEAVSLSIISNKVCARVKVTDIEWIEQNGRKISIVTQEQDYYCYTSIKNVLPALGKSFYSAMKSCIINFDKVKKMQDKEIYFLSGRTYVMGRNNYIKTRQAYKDYLTQYPPYLRMEKIQGSQAIENG